jgi:uncharacterized protein YecE (DUF72 family)
MSRAAAIRPAEQPGSIRPGQTRIGISGWRYAGWRGSFYPAGLRQRDEPAYASRQVDTIEINGTHYSLQHPDSFARWHDETPDDFIFAVKGSRCTTHMKQLRDIDAPLANFFASGVLRLEEKLGRAPASMRRTSTHSLPCCRATWMAPEKRAEIARKAAAKRWTKL